MGNAAIDHDASTAVQTAVDWSVAGAGALATNLVQRILLVTDGTVTNLLEAYAGEHVAVVKLQQETEPAPHTLADLDVRAEDEILRREVLLRGRESGRTLVYALSYIVPSRLDPALRQGLLDSVKPIGRLLEENRVETFREILSAGREPAAGMGIHFGIGRDALMVSRTYRIVVAGRPVMRITERFPADAFGGAT